MAIVHEDKQLPLILQDPFDSFDIFFMFVIGYITEWANSVGTTRIETSIGPIDTKTLSTVL